MCPIPSLQTVTETQPIAIKSEEPVEAVLATLKGATTLMLCDLPLELGASGAVALLESHGLAADVDYCYLPRGYGRKSKRRCNGSVSAFVNFTSTEAAARAVRTFHNLEVDERRVYACRAASQGLAANLLHFRSVRCNKVVLETSWPWVTNNGKLEETKPYEAAGVLGIEPEIEALRALAQAEAAAAKAEAEDNSDKASTTSSKATETTIATEADLEVEPETMPVLPVTPDMVAAYATLLASLPTESPAQVLDNWWAGQLDWTLAQQNTAWSMA